MMLRQRLHEDFISFISFVYTLEKLENMHVSQAMGIRICFYAGMHNLNTLLPNRLPDVLKACDEVLNQTRHKEEDARECIRQAVDLVKRRN